MTNRRYSQWLLFGPVRDARWRSRQRVRCSGCEPWITQLPAVLALPLVVAVAYWRWSGANDHRVNLAKYRVMH